MRLPLTVRLVQGESEPRKPKDHRRTIPGLSRLRDNSQLGEPDDIFGTHTFARYCGVSPIDASSGTVVRKRLNRGGNRQANHALWRIVMVRLFSDPATREYKERRTKEGLSKLETIRCLKRYVAREVYLFLAPNAP